MKKTWLLIGLILALLLCLAGCGKDETKKDEAAPTKKEEVKPTDTPVPEPTATATPVPTETPDDPDDDDDPDDWDDWDDDGDDPEDNPNHVVVHVSENPEGNAAWIIVNTLILCPREAEIIVKVKRTDDGSKDLTDQVIGGIGIDSETPDKEHEFLLNKYNPEKGDEFTFIYSVGEFFPEEGEGETPMKLYFTVNEDSGCTLTGIDVEYDKE